MFIYTVKDITIVWLTMFLLHSHPFSLQHEGHVSGGEELAKFPGAAVWQVGGELVRCGRATLLHHLGHAHTAPWALEELTHVLPEKAPGHRTHPQSLSRVHQQVRYICWLSIITVNAGLTASLAINHLFGETLMLGKYSRGDRWKSKSKRCCTCPSIV